MPVPATVYACACSSWLGHTVLQNTTSSPQYLMIIMKQTVLQRTFLKKTVFQRAVLSHTVLQRTPSEPKMVYPDDIACSLFLKFWTVSPFIR